MAIRKAGDVPPETENRTLRYVTIVIDVEADEIDGIYYPNCTSFEALGALKVAARDQEAFLLGEDDE